MQDPSFLSDQLLLAYNRAASTPSRTQTLDALLAHSPALLSNPPRFVQLGAVAADVVAYARSKGLLPGSANPPPPPLVSAGGRRRLGGSSGSSSSSLGQRAGGDAGVGVIEKRVEGLGVAKLGSNPVEHFDLGGAISAPRHLAAGDATVAGDRMSVPQRRFLAQTSTTLAAIVQQLASAAASCNTVLGSAMDAAAQAASSGVLPDATLFLHVGRIAAVQSGALLATAAQVGQALQEGNTATALAAAKSLATNLTGSSLAKILATPVPSASPGSNTPNSNGPTPGSWYEYEDPNPEDQARSDDGGKKRAVRLGVGIGIGIGGGLLLLAAAGAVLYVVRKRKAEAAANGAKGQPDMFGTSNPAFEPAAGRGGQGTGAGAGAPPPPGEERTPAAAGNTEAMAAAGAAAAALPAPGLAAAARKTGPGAGSAGLAPQPVIATDGATGKGSKQRFSTVSGGPPKKGQGTGRGVAEGVEQVQVQQGGWVMCTKSPLQCAEEEGNECGSDRMQAGGVRAAAGCMAPATSGSDECHASEVVVHQLLHARSRHGGGIH